MIPQPEQKSSNASGTKLTLVGIVGCNAAVFRGDGIGPLEPRYGMR